MQTTAEPRGLARLRAERGLSQEALARLASIGVKSVRNIERGVFRPGIDTARAIARALDITVDALIEALDEGTSTLARDGAVA